MAFYCVFYCDRLPLSTFVIIKIFEAAGEVSPSFVGRTVGLFNRAVPLSAGETHNKYFDRTKSSEKEVALIGAINGSTEPRSGICCMAGITTPLNVGRCTLNHWNTWLMAPESLVHTDTDKQADIFSCRRWLLSALPNQYFILVGSLTCANDGKFSESYYDDWCFVFLTR